MDHTLKHLFPILFLTIFFQATLCAQERKLFYDVKRNGKIIGNINYIEMKKGQSKFISMTSDVKTWYILPFSDNTSETATFEDDVMVSSTFYQKQTGSPKTDKTTIVSGKFYKLTDNGVSKLISMSPIRYNMLLLYTIIPERVTKVYSANFQKELDIKKLGENKYQLTLPDGKHNYYTYKNGVCTMVEIVRTLFTLQFVLRGP